MGNSKTSRYADGKAIYDLNQATASWLRGLAQAARFELTGDVPRGIRRLLPARRLQALRDALRRAPSPKPVSVRRGAGEVQRMLLDPDISPRLRRLARRRRHDEGDVASLWARVRVDAQSPSLGPLAEADPA